MNDLNYTLFSQLFFTTKRIHFRRKYFKLFYPELKITSIFGVMEDALLPFRFSHITLLPLPPQTKLNNYYHLLVLLSPHSPPPITIS
jgi:hypothetical protein